MTTSHFTGLRGPHESARTNSYNRASLRRIFQAFAVGILFTSPTLVWPQTVVTTVPVEGGTVAVNPVTGKIYTATCLLDQRKPATNGSVTAIDGNTYATTAITTGVCPTAVAINPLTNKIYVANAGQTSIVCGSCFNLGSVTIIDGATNTAMEISDPNAQYPAAIAVNTATNKIYVANSGSSNVTVIDGVTNAVTTVTDPNAAAASLSAYALAVDETTNKIYVANNNLRWDVASAGNVTVIDGATNATATVTDPNSITPYAVAVNSKTNQIYVANLGSGYPGPNRGNVTIIDGATNSTLTVMDPNAVAPQAVVVNEATNQIYVANINDTSLSENGGVTVIDGASHSVTSLRDSNAIAPIALAVDPMTNKVYVANEGSRPEFSGNNPGCVTVIDGETNVTTTLIGPQGPHAVAINAIVDQIYLASSGVTVIDGGGTPTTHALGVVMAGTGSGSVTSSPLGITCGPTCAENVAVGSAISLNAMASSGSVFAGWSGPCNGAGSCNLVADSDEFVTATFKLTAPAQVIVPTVVGMTQATAMSAITGAGLITGTVSMQSSATVPSGNVISESPAAGTNVPSGSAVNLEVSTGSPDAGSTAGNSSDGGGGGIDGLSIGLLLSALILNLRAAGAVARKRLSDAGERNRKPQIDSAKDLPKAAFAGRGALKGPIFALSLLLGAGLAAPLAAQQFVSSPRAQSGRPDSPISNVLGEPRQRANLAPRASREIIWSACPALAVSAGAAECGYLPVPLFWGSSAPTIDIYFEVYLHSASGPAVSAIFANGGGPGVTTTGLRSVALSLYGALDVHDMVLFDDRGRGSSAAIDCPDLQHGTAPFDQAVAECAAQLGAGASAYGTGAIADDAEALRMALGYDKIDYVGLSYGAEDATAYATRYGAHVRSIVLDAPAGSPYLARFAADQGSTQSIPRSIALGCRRSPTCAVDHPDPDAELGALIHSIHNHPLIGSGNNAFGAPTAVSLDEGSLAALLTAGTFPPSGSGAFVDNNEVLAAARAYAAGDSVPLLRIAAEGSIPLSTEYGDPTFYSEGAFIATLCVDMQQPFSWRDPVSMRGDELREAITDLPTDYFAPFTTDVARYPIFAFEGQCLNWQKPTPSDPVLPPRPAFPDVPVLVLHGDMDAAVSTEEARAVAAQFRQNTFVSVASSGHITADYGFFGACAAYNFLEDLRIDDTTCAQTPHVDWPAVGRFPLLASDAMPAEPAPGIRGNLHDLKVVSVAVATMKDALQRIALGSISGVGLRGGTFLDTSGATSQVITLNGCRFTQDVSVSGTVIYGFDTSLSASLSVTLSDGTTGTLNVTGAFLEPGPVGNFSITGSIGGRQIAAFVPEA